jgi:hypothetical protein
MHACSARRVGASCSRVTSVGARPDAQLLRAAAGSSLPELSTVLQGRGFKKLAAGRLSLAGAALPKGVLECRTGSQPI